MKSWRSKYERKKKKEIKDNLYLITNKIFIDVSFISIEFQ